MKEVSVDIVRRMIEFMYTGDYSENLAEPAEDEQSISPFSIHFGVFALADMYLVGELRALSVTKYGIALKRSSDYTGFLQSVDDMYKLTPHTARELREKAIAFTRDVLPRYLKQPIELLTDYEKESLKASRVGKYPSPAHRVLFEDLLAVVPEFARDLVISFIQEPLRGKCSENCTGKGVMVPVEARDYKCKKCNGGVTRSIFQS